MNAAKKLALASPYLTQDQVERIESLLRDSDLRFKKSATYTDKYEEIPVRYYAALAVQDMRSPYMTEGVKGVAAGIINEVNQKPLGERVYVDAQIIDELGLAAP